LVKGVSESLAGRIVYMELTGIGLTELPTETDYIHNWFRGGFPNALLAGSDAESKEWLNALIRSYVERDLAHLFGVELAPSTLRRIPCQTARSLVCQCKKKIDQIPESIHPGYRYPA
jgi:uncharacterized protein